MINEFFIVRSIYLRHHDQENKNRIESDSAFAESSSKQSSSYLHDRSFWQCFGWQIYMQLVPSFLFAAITTQCITDITKYSIGRLRPHFIDLCRPQFRSSSTGQLLTLTRESNCIDPYAYVERYTCTNENYFTDWKDKDAHLSFMSGHSSIAASCLIYLVIYIQSRFRWVYCSDGLISHLYQCGLIFLAIYTGLSRISDYKHHWSDVLTGLVQGTMTTTFVAVFVSNLIKLRTSYQVVDGNVDIATAIKQGAKESFKEADDISEKSPVLQFPINNHSNKFFDSNV